MLHAIGTARSRLTLLGIGFTLAAIAFACGGDDEATPPATTDNDAASPGSDAGGEIPDGSSDIADASLDSGDGGDGGDGGAGVAIYAHGPSTLYKIDPIAKALTVVGDFSGGCTNVIDLALDHESNAFVTSFDGLYKLDLKTAACTLVANGAYPNSLSFVPKGTLDPNAEALVGYSGSHYVRIDTTTGAVTAAGELQGGYISSGDIVSVEGGGTFLSVVGGSEGCGDCLVQINPSTGDIVRNYGALTYDAVYGVAFWAGTIYGFSGEHMFAADWQDGGLVTVDIELANMPDAGIDFYGAGSTTAAPLGPDGGTGLPLGND